MLTLISLSLLSGCTEYVAHRIVERRDNPKDVTELPPELDLVQSCIRIPVGPPDATLFCQVFEPRQHIVVTTKSEDVNEARAIAKAKSPKGDYQVVYGWITHEKNVEWIWTLLQMPAPKWRGTVILLHGDSGGVRSDKYLVPLASLLSDAGYRVVYLDLRAQGDSTGKYVNIGGRIDQKDFSQVLDYLQSHHLAGKSVIVIGISYGANVAPALAAGDPRVAAAVCLSTGPSLLNFYATYHEGPYKEQMKRLYPLEYIFVLPWLSEEDWQKAATRAGQLGDFDPDSAADSAVWITKTKVPVLLVHGTKDMNVPLSCSQRIQDARPDNTTFIKYEGEDHSSYLPRDDFRQAVLAWLEKNFRQPVGCAGP